MHAQYQRTIRAALAAFKGIMGHSLHIGERGGGGLDIVSMSMDTVRFISITIYSIEIIRKELFNFFV
jgi:hypothetical protein